MRQKYNHRWFALCTVIFFTATSCVSLFSCVIKNKVDFNYTDIREPVDIVTLKREITSENKYVRLNAVNELKKFEGSDKRVLPVIAIALSDTDFEVRKCAVTTLEKILPNDKDIYELPLLMSKLKWVGWRVPKEAAFEIGQRGEHAKGAVPELVKVIDKNNNWSTHYNLVRREAIIALGKIGPQASNAVPSLIKTLDSIDIDIRKESIIALGKIGVGADASVFMLKQIAQKDKVKELREDAISALNKITMPSE